ncbi:hypothetical protein RJ55_01030 [Drechmeria coniospora]|nr:hypothetical protein RJ55_01030 [Drechmeria coniospora]
MFAPAIISTQGRWFVLEDTSIPIVAVCAVVTLLLLVYRRLSRPLRGPLRHVPGPLLSKLSALPLCFYDLTYCRTDQIHQWHRRYGPVVCIAPNEISVATLEATKDVYGTTQRWAKSDYFDHFRGFNVRSVFATKPYREHGAKRRLTSTFYQATAIYNRPAIEQHVQERARAVLRQIQPGQEIDVYSLTDWYAFDIITYLALGPDQSTRSVDGVCAERQLLMELKHLQFAGPFRVRYPRLFSYASGLLGRLIPRLGHLLADEKLATWCRRRVVKAMKHPHSPGQHSLIGHLLEAPTRQGEKEAWLDDAYVAAEVLDNINAAEATVAVTATYLIWRLTEHPWWQERIRSELNELPLQTDGSLSFAQVNSQVPSLEACLREVYRLHPASSGRAERIVPNGGRTLSGVHLPEGTIVTSSITSLHRDETLFPDPEGFHPERWLDVDEATFRRRDAQLIPFGHGGRVCLGKALATLEIKLLMARLFLHHEALKTPSTTEASMKQCSTHDAVPRALKCMIRFQVVGGKV